VTFLAELEGATGWLGQKGVYRQVPLYRRGDAIFAKWGAGYIRLRASGATSTPNVIWLELDGGDLYRILTAPMKDPLYAIKFPDVIAVE
jgi:hypothetical protein